MNIKFEYNDNETIMSADEGTLEDGLVATMALVNGLYRNAKARNPEMAEKFKSSVRGLLNSDKMWEIELKIEKRDKNE